MAYFLGPFSSCDSEIRGGDCIACDIITDIASPQVNTRLKQENSRLRAALSRRNAELESIGGKVEQETAPFTIDFCRKAAEKCLDLEEVEEVIWKLGI